MIYSKRLIFCFFAALLTLTKVTAQSDSEQRMKLAESFEKGGDYRAAAKIYLELSAASPGNDAYFNSAVRTHKAVSMFSELIPIIEKRLAVKENSATLAVYAEMLWRTGKPELADSKWARAIELGSKG